jgi:hypothetical protein
VKAHPEALFQRATRGIVPSHAAAAVKDEEVLRDQVPIDQLLNPASDKWRRQF